MGLQDAAGFSKITFSFTNRYKDKAGTNTKTKPNTNSNKKTKSQDWGVMGQEPSPNSTPPLSPGSLSPSVVTRATLLAALLSQRFTNNLSAAVKLCMKCTRARAFLDAILIAWNFITGISMIIIWARLLKDINMEHAIVWNNFLLSTLQIGFCIDFEHSNKESGSRWSAWLAGPRRSGDRWIGAQAEQLVLQHNLICS